MTLSPLPWLLAAASPLEDTWKVLEDGGLFMLAILACSLVGLVVIVLKALMLSRGRIVPVILSRKIEALPDPATEGDLEILRGESAGGDSVLARLCSGVLEKRGSSAEEVKESVQSTAREEIVRMSMGLAILDVILTIGPLLGLLGTASGLVVVFKDVGADGNYVALAKGISRALSTTIAGVAVAVPAVVAHSYFSRKIETLSARLEVLIGRMVSLSHPSPRD